ncbi:NfeD family protein [Thaumasiovibrio sp. DFM-14]|uniref:NfeD family protein n=1 Tax=Thaumasiovibrio sp. DFM-14 TaxID=3384792 RepID=UPI00399FDB1A
MGFDNYLAEWLIAGGIALIVIEVAVLGISTIILLIGGVSLIVTGLAYQFELVQRSNLPILLAVTLTVLMVLLYKPLQKFQNKTDDKNLDLDFSRHQLILESDVDKDSKTTYQYSGVAWVLKSNSPIPAGTEVKVVKMEVGVMWVVPTNPKHENDATSADQ